MSLSSLASVTPSAPTPPSAPSASSLASSARSLSAAAPAGASRASAATPGTVVNPVSTMRFDVTVDGMDLGSFTSFEGLTFSYEVKTYEEGGENGYVHQLPGRMKYENIKVARPLDAGSPALALYFTKLAKEGRVKRGNATVKAYNDNSEAVATWTFTGVYPVRYAGPSFTADGGKVAIETFEFAHAGLLT